MPTVRWLQVRFVVVHGEPKARLVDCVVHPQTFLAAGGRLQLHGHYYITKQILPALDRLFSLLGVDVHEWYASMSRPQRLLPHKRPASMLPTRAPHPLAVVAACYDLLIVLECFGCCPATLPVPYSLNQ